MTQLMYVENDSPTSRDGRLNAACSLGEAEQKQRLAQWIALRDRCVDVRVTAQGVLLVLADDEPLDAVAGLVGLESQCCGFYRFSLRVSDGTRELEIDAGPGGADAVAALLSIGSSPVGVPPKPTSSIGG